MGELSVLGKTRYLEVDTVFGFIGVAFFYKIRNDGYHLLNVFCCCWVVGSGKNLEGFDIFKEGFFVEGSVFGEGHVVSL